jgi:hypothetical protein
MTTVAQMIEWLKTLPPEAEVQCREEESCGYSTYTVMADVDIASCSINDYRKDPKDGFKWHPDFEGKVIVEISS